VQFLFTILFQFYPCYYFVLNFLNDLEKGFRNGIMEGEKMESYKKEFLKL
jgi:hypothetical protein